MKDASNHDQAVELLQKLGLKEYEAKCLVALSRLPKATAKEISETSDVPRTRVYDAIRVLESKGLVEIQHSNPQQFRAVPIAEAGETLRQEYESRTETLVETLTDIEPAQSDAEEKVAHEVWSLTGTTAIQNRTQQLIEAAEEELILIVGREEVLTGELLTKLRTAQETGISVIVGTLNDAIRERIQDAVPGAKVFVSELDWLNSSPLQDTDDTVIGRLLLADGNTILVSSAHETDTGAINSEKAVFGRGFDNGLVVIARRLMATGLEPVDIPETAEE